MKKLMFLQFRPLPACAGRRDYRRVIGTFVIMFAFSLISCAQPVFAKVMIQEKGTLTIPSTETISDDLFVAGQNVELSGTVTGDVFVATGNLTLSGASIGGSLVVASGNVTIDKDSSIDGSLIVATGNLKNSGSVGRNLMVGAGTIYQNGSVGKEARVGAGTLELGPSADLGGDLTYALGDQGSDIVKDPSSRIAGTVTHFVEPEQAKADITRAREASRKAAQAFHGFWAVFALLSSLLIGSILLRLFPKTIAGLSSELTANPLRCLGVGFLIVVLSVPVLLSVSFTVIGLPLAGLLLTLLILGLHLARLVTAFTLGQFVCRQFSLSKLSVYLVFALGLTLFTLFKLLPGFGWLISFLCTWVGLGAILAYLTSHLKNL